MTTRPRFKSGISPNVADGSSVRVTGHQRLTLALQSTVHHFLLPHVFTAKKFDPGLCIPLSGVRINTHSISLEEDRKPGAAVRFVRVSSLDLVPNRGTHENYCHLLLFHDWETKIHDFNQT